jgi:hypothetical protein
MPGANLTGHLLLLRYVILVCASLPCHCCKSVDDGPNCSDGHTFRQSWINHITTGKGSQEAAITGASTSRVLKMQVLLALQCRNDYVGVKAQDAQTVLTQRTRASRSPLPQHSFPRLSLETRQRGAQTYAKQHVVESPRTCRRDIIYPLQRIDVNSDWRLARVK